LCHTNNKLPQKWGSTRKWANGPLFLLDEAAMDVTTRIERLIAPTIEAMGYELVRVALGGGRQSARLQVMAERKDRAPMRVDDCAEISRTISAVLDVEDPIEGAYTLEVSSPGLDRPLTRKGDFDRFKGFEARIESARPIEGRRKFKGRLEGLDGETVRIRCDGAEVGVPLADVAKAKLIITDELLKAAAKDGTEA
jgi:ribosome maturation factor RimP